MSERSFDAVHFAADAPDACREIDIFEAPTGGVRYPNIDAAAAEQLCVHLMAQREMLRAHPVRRLAHWLGSVGERFLDRSDVLRIEALDHLPKTSGLSPQMSAAVLDGMAADWVEARLLELLEREFDDPSALDGFVSRGDGKTMAIGPSFTAQIVAGSVPGVGVSALIRSLLLKSPTLLKPGLGDVVLPVLFARGLEAAHPQLARGLAVLYWPGGHRDLEDAVLAEADAVTVYGDDATVASLRDRVPLTTRFVGYHHRTSVGVVAREALEPDRVAHVAAEVARAVGYFDGKGCVSPQVIYVEGGPADGRTFAKRLAVALEGLERDLPGGPLRAADLSALQQLRGTAELLATSTGAVDVHHREGASWTVLFEGTERLDMASLARVVRVRSLESLDCLSSELVAFAGHLQTVGVAGHGRRLEGLARALARLGASRIVPFESVPFPPPWWHHDGGGPLRDLVRWADLGSL